MTEREEALEEAAKVATVVIDRLNARHKRRPDVDVSALLLVADRIYQGIRALKSSSPPPKGGEGTPRVADLIEVPHPSEFIREEMDERDWGTPSMARHMGGDYGINRLAIEMYLSVGPQNDGLRLGDMAADIARAFGVSVEFIQNMEAAWLRYIERRALAPDGKATLPDEMGAEQPKAASEHLLTENARLREALEEIAKQELSADMSVDDQIGGDFEGAYNHMIEQARAALSERTE